MSRLNLICFFLLIISIFSDEKFLEKDKLKYLGEKAEADLSEKSNTIFGPENKDIVLSDVLTSAESLINNVKSKYGIPRNVSMAGSKYNVSNIVIILAKAIVDISKGTSAKYTPKTETINKLLGGDWIKDTIPKAEYIKVAQNVYNYLTKNSAVPNYATLPSTSHRANYLVYTHAFSNVLYLYKQNKALPSSIPFDNTVFNHYYITPALKAKVKQKIKFWLTSDNIKTKSYEQTALNTLKDTLIKLGYSAQIVGIGPDYHNNAYKSGCKGSSNVLLCCFGGVDVGCIEEWAGQWGTWYSLK